MLTSFLEYAVNQVIAIPREKRDDVERTFLRVTERIKRSPGDRRIPQRIVAPPLYASGVTSLEPVDSVGDVSLQSRRMSSRMPNR